MSGGKMSGAQLDIWTLYYRRSNHKKDWVVRLFQNGQPTDTVFEADTRKACEEFVLERRPGAIWLTRSPGDDMVIVGTWI